MKSFNDHIDNPDKRRASGFGTCHFAILPGILLVGGLVFTLTIHAAAIQTLPYQVPAVVRQISPVGNLSASERLHLAIGLPLRDQNVLTNLLRQIYNPESRYYRHYLTPDQFARRFGPTQEAYQAVIAFAQANGLTVIATHPNRVLLDVEGSVADIERAFHVTLRRYQHPTEPRTFYAPDAEPSVDLSAPLLGISGLDDFSLPRPRAIAQPLADVQQVTPNTGSGPGGTYMGYDFRSAYVPDTSMVGSGQVVGLVQYDGYNRSDVDYYLNHAGLPSVTLSNVLLDGFSGNPTGSGGEVEVCLDIEMSISMAPGLSMVIVYEAGPYGNWYDMLNRMATDNLAKQLSCSWYSPHKGRDPVADQIFLQMAAQGQSFFNASGDDDAFTGLIDFPGDVAYITQVGGTTLTTTGPGGSWVSETVWNWGGGTGSGGGISTSYPIPSWQTNIDMTASQGSTTMRNTPDVALTADNVYVRANGRDYNVGGTSCAAPLWAGLTALINQQAVSSGRAVVGFINPAVYGLPNYTSCFHDITNGNNTWSGSPTKFYAVPGYDLCTGWGTPGGQGLIDAIGTPDPLLIQPGNGFAAFGAMGGPFDVTAQTFSLTNTQTASLQWSVTSTSIWLDASPTGGTLSTGGPAAAVTVSLNDVASGLVPGNYSAAVWFTNLSSGFGQSRLFTLVVVPSNDPPVILTQPASLTIYAGHRASFSVIATGTPPLSYQWSFNGTNLADATNRTLLLTNVQLSQAGNYAVQVSNRVESILSSNALLTVNPPPPCVAAPSDLVGWWRAEDNVLDTTGANDGVPLGNLGYGDGQVGEGFNLNGYDAGVELPASSTLDVGSGGGLTIEGWINPSTIGVERPIVEWNDAAGGVGAHLWISVAPKIGNGPGCLYANLWDTAGTWHILSSAGGLVVSNTWQHVGLTYDKASGVAKLYLNGAVVAQQNLGVFTPQTTYDCYIGHRASGGASAFWWVGLLDEISIYNRALTDSEIQGIYSADGGGKCFALTPPMILTQPSGEAVTVGSSATFSVVASGTPPLSYQWYFNMSQAVIGETNATLMLTNVQANQGGSYSVVVSNAFGTVVSSNALLTVNVGLPCATAPPGLVGWWRAEGNGQDTAGTNNGVVLGNLTYGIGEVGQAFNLNGVDAAVKVPAGPGVDVGQGDGFTVEGWINPAVIDVERPIVEWNDGKGGLGVHLWVSEQPIFGTGPGCLYANIVDTNGNFHTFASAAGLVVSSNFQHVALTYDKASGVAKLYLSGQVVAQQNLGTFMPQTSYDLNLGNRPWGQAHAHWWVGLLDEMSLYNRALSDAQIEAIYNAGTDGKCFGAAPIIVTQPTNQTVVAGSNATFTVVASGTAPLYYQWFFNTTDVLWGETNASLALTNIQPTQAGTYSVLVTNAIGSELSSNALLTVIPLGYMQCQVVAGQLELQFHGMPGQSYYIQGSADLVHWLVIGVATDLGNGNFEFADPYWGLRELCFYRVIKP